jgi:hypothetical protein
MAFSATSHIQRAARKNHFLSFARTTQDPGLLIAHPNSIYLVLSVFGLTNKKPSPLPKIMIFFRRVPRQTFEGKGKSVS